MPFIVMNVVSLFVYTHFASSSLIAAFLLPYSPPFTKLTPVLRSQPPFGALSWKNDQQKFINY